MLRARSSCLYDDWFVHTVLKVDTESTRPVTLYISVPYKPQLPYAETNTEKSKRQPLWATKNTLSHLLSQVEKCIHVCIVTDYTDIPLTSMLVSSTMLILVTLTPEALIVIFGTMYLLKLVPVDISLAASCVVCDYHIGLQKLNNNSLQWILLWGICLMQ